MKVKELKEELEKHLDDTEVIFHIPDSGGYDVTLSTSGFLRKPSLREAWIAETNENSSIIIDGYEHDEHW